MSTMLQHQLIMCSALKELKQSNEALSKENLVFKEDIVLLKQDV